MLFHYFALCVLLSSVVTSTNSQDAGNTQQQTLSSKGRPCNINNYNSFHAGPNKKVESLIVDMKRQLDDLRRQVAILIRRDNSTNSQGRYSRCKVTVILPFSGQFCPNHCACYRAQITPTELLRRIRRKF